MRIIEPLTDAERVRFVASARSLVGTPFKHRGRTARGLDCVGMVAHALASVGRTVEDRKGYGRDPSRDGLRDVVRAHFGEPAEGMQAGDIALMRWYRDGGDDMFNHVAIIGDYYLGGFSLIHAFAAVGSVIEHRLADPWPRRIVEVYR